ncbi:glycoside hydrolase family 5 protein [Cedecea davisae]|nr:cellulase family glycosylhydrolase [Cedecea davisae]
MLNIRFPSLSSVPPMLKPILALVALSFCAGSFAAQTEALPPSWTSQLGVGMNVDWAITERGIREFDPLAVRDFQQRGFGHVRIRVAGPMTHQKLVHLRRIVDACEQYNIVPVISYRAAELKAKPNAENATDIVEWWTTVARFFGKNDDSLVFDIIGQPEEKLSANPQLLNQVYDKTVKAIHKISPQRHIFVAPRYHGSPEALAALKIPESHHGLVMADWHLMPSGPHALNGKSQWTTGTDAEKAAIHARIEAASRWQQKTGHLSWVGNWSVGSKLPVDQQVAMATFVACELQKAQIPYAVSGDEKFYDGEEGAWRPDMAPVLDAILKPQCQ